jgi:hypothetical protein
MSSASSVSARSVRAVPPAVWLVLLVAASTVVRYAFARRMVAPWIMIDEIVYSELAKSFAATGDLAVRGVPTSGYGVVYPIVISPAYALFDAVPTAYAAIKAINSLALSLAAVPAYLLARRVVRPRYALVVAVLTVAVPSTIYAGVVMTENVFYAIFLVAALALVAALERPTPLRVGLFLAATGVAYFTRAQAIALVPAALTAPLLVVRPRALARFRWLYGLVVGLALLAVAVELARGRSLSSLLGAYSAATDQRYTLGATAKWLLWHLGELDLYVGIVPVVALVVLARLLGRLETAERAVVAATLALVGWFGIEVAAFATQPSVLRIEERNLFYVAPLLFTALAVWMERGLPRPRVTTAVAAAGGVLLAASVPYDRFIGVGSTADTLMTLPLWSLSNWFAIPLENLRWIVAALALAFALVAALVPRRARIVLPLLVLALYVAVVQPVDARTRKAAVGALFQGITNPDRDWIDAAAGRGSTVGALWSGLNDRLTINENEFFNRSVGPVYHLREPVPGNLAETPVRVDRATGYLVDPNGARVRVPYVLADTSLPLGGRVVARDENRGLLLLRVRGALRVRYVADGADDDGWAGAAFTVRSFDPRCRSVAVRLGSDPNLFHRPQVVRALVRGRVVATVRVPPDRERTLRVPACNVQFRVGRTAVPALVNGSADTRRLGIRVVSLGVR